MLSILGNASVLALLSLLVSIVPMILGITYAIRPSEGRLALMRPVSLAGLFAGLSALAAGVIGALMGAAGSPEGFANRNVALGLSEAIVPLFVGFGCLTVGWLCVALGMRRQPS